MVNRVSEFAPFRIAIRYGIASKESSFLFTHLPVLVMIISVPTSLNCDQSSEFSRSALMFGSLCPGGPTEAEDDGSIPIRGTGAGVANGIPGIPANIVKVSKFRRCGVVASSSLCKSGYPCSNVRVADMIGAAGRR